MQALEFLIVEAAGQRFAVATALVKTAVTLLPVSPLPFVPAFVEGLVNINERIVPQLDLALLLGASSATAGGELVLVETRHSPCALHVAHILGKADLAATDLQPIAGEDGALPVTNRFEWQGGSVLVLDVERIGGRIGSREVPDGERGLLGRLQGAEHESARAAVLDCIVLAVAGERYALALADVVEILDLPAATPVPGAPAGVEGLAMVRDDVMLVLSLARLLAGGGAESPARGSVVVVEREAVRYGLRVDAVEGLEQLDAACLRRIDEPGSEVEGVIAAGDRLYGLLTPQRIINPERHRLYRPLAPQRQRQDARREEKQHAVLQVMLGDEVFGIALGQVRRILDYCPPEPVQAEPDSLVAGAVNIDGRVVPVVDLGRYLRLGAGNDGAWVIVGDEREEWAIPVREASDIVSIPDSALESVTAGRGGFVSAIATVQDRLLSLLSLAPLFRGGMA
ncbi:MAG: chemotaxis protein CheW [Pseudomonadota bacterium]